MSSYPVKFGKYLLLERVNVGGMAEVFKAKTFGVAGFERILAIKRILPNLVEDEEFIRMFIDEARIAVQLNHTNIVQIYELGKHGEHYYIAMEYIGSRDLRAILDRMRANGQLMAIPQAAYIIAKVCEGLDYAHKRRDPQGNPMNIIHRDVSPQNILLGFEGEVKVIDFGIAKAANRASKTQAGVLKGKFGYMSPEQVRGLPTDRRSDIFAVGVLLYEMLTGERLFIGESDFSTLERVRNAEVTPPTRFNKKISPQLEEIVLKTLAREVEDRYQWASDLADELQPFLREDPKTVFNMKRLASLMKDTYAAEINLEKAKLDEFLRISAEDARPERGSQNAQSSILPLNPPAPAKPSVPPPRAMLSEEAEEHVEISDDEEEAAAGFGEDKTFVIEASTAGLALQGTHGVADPRAVTSLGEESAPELPRGNGAAKPAVKSPSTKAPAAPSNRSAPVIAARAEPRAASEKSSTAPRGSERPATANEDYLQQVSLYGDESADEDDSRTMVSVANPFFNKDGGGATDESDAESDIDASEVQDPNPVPRPPPRDMSVDQDALTAALGGRDDMSDAPTMAAAAGAVHDAVRRAIEKPGARAGVQAAALDPVAAAMEDEDQLALEILKGTTGGRGGRSPPPTRPHGDDFAGAQMPVTGAEGMDRTELGPPIATETAAELAPVLPSFDAGPRTPAEGDRPDRGDDDRGDFAAPVAAVSPQMLRVILAATGASALLFLVVFVVVVVRLTGGGGDAGGTVVLYSVGDAKPTGDVIVTVDGKEVARALPASFPLKAGVHALKLEARGMKPVERKLKVNGATVKQPVLWTVAAADAAPDAEANPTREPTNEPTPDAAPAAGTRLAMRVPPPVVGGWRLSLAAVADDSGRPILDAEVLIDSEPYGNSPFEAEIDGKKEKVEVRVRATGYETRSMDIERAGRAQVGPATVRLVPARSGTAPASDPAGTAPTGDAGGTGTATDAASDPTPKVAATPPAAVSAPDKSPPGKATPATAEPTPKAAAKTPDKPSDKPSDKADKPADKVATKASDKPAASEKPADAPRPKAKLGRLQIGTRPTMQVSLDGKVKGSKLFYGPDALELSIGSHTLELVDAKTKKKYKLKVTVNADDPANKVVFDGTATPPGIKTYGSTTAKLQ